MSVLDLRRNIERWDGEVVTIDGWLGVCAGYDCAIYQSSGDFRAVMSHDMGSQKWSEAVRKGVSIGFSEQFDRDAKPLQDSPVRLVARVNKECWPANCLDRSDVLQPISIKRAS